MLRSGEPRYLYTIFQSYILHDILVLSVSMGLPFFLYSESSCCSAHFPQLNPCPRQSIVSLCCLLFLGVPALQWAGRYCRCWKIIKFYSSSFIKYILIYRTGLVIFFLTFKIFLKKKRFCIEVQLINIVALVSDEQWRDSAIHIHVSILPQIPLPSRLPHNQSSMCYAVGHLKYIVGYPF